MKIILSFFMFTTLGSAAPWIDPNGVEWMLLKPKANFATAKRNCTLAGYQLPSAESFWEAIELGLLDPKTNAVFDAAARKIDWIWTGKPMDFNYFAWMASRWEDEIAEDAGARHWVLCARKNP